MGGPNAKRFDHFNRHSHWHAGPNRGKTACHAYTLRFQILTVSE